MIERRRLGLGLATSTAAILLLELGVLARASSTLAALGAPPEEMDVLRAMAWPIALGAGALVTWMATPPPPERGAHELEEAVADRDWLRGLLDAMEEGVIAFDRHGRVVFANRAALELLSVRGIPDGTPMVAFSDVPRLRSTVVRALRGKETVARELEVPGPPARTVLLRTTPTRHGAVAVLLDISTVRRIERSWRDFAANASHELRTPAAAIMANLEAAVDAPPEIRDRFLGSALRQAQRLGQLVGDLMDLVRIESGQVEVQADEVRLDELARGCVEEQEAAHPEVAGRVTVDVPAELAACADSGATRQVVSNLLSNALRYTDAPVEVRGWKQGRMVRLEVRDHGPGIEIAQRERIFDRFYRVDEGRSRAMGGSGLGLSIVRELVDAMGGRVGVEDNEPTGLVLWVELPRWTGLEEPTSEEAPTAPPP